MNRSIIIYMLGWIMNMEAIFMTLPVVTAVVYRESIGFIYLGVAAVCGLIYVHQEEAMHKDVFCQGRICDGFPGVDCIELFRVHALCHKRGDSPYH